MVGKKEKGHPGKNKFLSSLVYLVGSFLASFRYKIRIESAESLNSAGPVIALAKHQRLMDIPLGYAALQKHMRRKDIWCLMKDSLTLPFQLLERCGGIPINRAAPEKTKSAFLFSRNMLYAGNLITIFPEQTYFPWKMGRGKVPGFRVIAGTPVSPLAVNCVGFEYGKKSFPRRSVTIRIGPTRFYTKEDRPVEFIHERMLEIAKLSNLDYKFPPASADQNA